MFPTQTQFTIPVTGDTLNEAAEAFTVTVAIADPDADGGTAIGSAAGVTTTIVDDDAITVAIGDIPTVYEGTTARFPLHPHRWRPRRRCDPGLHVERAWH